MGILLIKDHTARPAHVQTLRAGPTSSTPDTIRLDSCSRWEMIVVNTHSSVYELIVLQGKCGDVLARGGKHLPDFRRVTLVGATAGGSALKLNVIDVGFRMELHVDQKILFTSPVRAINRGSAAADVSEAAAAALLAVVTQ